MDTTKRLESEILLLRHELYSLKQDHEKLWSMNEALIKKNGTLILENQLLQNKIIKLEDKLNINSSNSGLPTSMDIYKVDKKKKRGSGLKPGARTGHSRNSYKFKTPDEIIEVTPDETICSCGGQIILSDEYSSHQKMEVEIQPVVSEYRLYSGRCVCCRKKYKGKLKEYKLLGKNIGAIITSLGGFFNNSKRDIQSILSQIFNIDISLGLISNTEGRVGNKLEGKYNDLMESVQNSSYLHLDESGANKKGKRGWCWVATNRESTVFKLTDSRGKKALESFLPEYEGKVISDRYAVYNIFDEDKRQVCLAHLRRDFKRFAHSKYVSLSMVGNSLLEVMDIVFATDQAFRSRKIERPYYLRRMRKSKKRMLHYLKGVLALHECEQAVRVARNILKSFDMMWRFVDDPEIEPTNNLAERQIKHHVKYRKNSLFTWSDRGDRFIERAKSIYASAKLQDINPWQELIAVI